jgi:hypothetical protein
MKFPPRDQTAEIVHPGKQPFHLPSTLVTTQGAAILRFAAIATIGRDHLDAIFFVQSLVQSVRIVGFIADQPFGQLVEEASGQNSFHKPALGRRSAFDSDGERKTITSGDSDDLGALAASGRADGEAPFLALAKVASTNASSRFSFPRSCKCLASRRSASTSLPSRTHRWKRRWQVWYGGYLDGNSAHCAPLPNIHSTPFSTARVSCHGRPRLSSRRAGRRTGSTKAHCSSFSSQRPAIDYLRRCLEHF